MEKVCTTVPAFGWSERAQGGHASLCPPYFMGSICEFAVCEAGFRDLASLPHPASPHAPPKAGVTALIASGEREQRRHSENTNSIV
jgi:hypothetical protein